MVHHACHWQTRKQTNIMSANELNIVISRLESELSLKKRVIEQYREKAEAFAVQQENFKQQHDAFQKEKDIFDKTIQKINDINSNTENIVVLNIGGSTFATTAATLSSNESIFRPILSGQFSVQKTQSGEIFIDRDPRMFPLILNYLRGELDVLQMRYKELSYSEMLQFRKDSAFYATKMFHLQEVSIERNREEIDDYWSYDGKTDALEFEINKEATLTSVTLFADDKFTAKMTIECDAELHKEESSRGTAMAVTFGMDFH
jgi:hypothetical protein